MRNFCNDSAPNRIFVFSPFDWLQIFPPWCPMKDAASQLPLKIFHLEEGHLVASPGQDIYLYNFVVNTGPWPKISAKGQFTCPHGTFTARLIDRQGPQLCLAIYADKVLGRCVGGKFQTAPTGLTELKKSSELLGANIFLDPHDGWAISVAESSGQNKRNLDLIWPQITLSNLNEQIPKGISFIWRQNPQPHTNPIMGLVTDLVTSAPTGDNPSEGATTTDGPSPPRILIVGDSPTVLEPLCTLKSALFLGPAPPKSPLYHLSLYTKAALNLVARDELISSLRNKLSDVKKKQAAIKAHELNWEDLEELEKNYQSLRKAAEVCLTRGEKARQEVKKIQASWDKALTDSEKSKHSLLNWFRPNSKAQTHKENILNSEINLGQAEKTMVTMRLEEEALLKEARHLDERLKSTQEQSLNWPDSQTLKHKKEALRAEESRLETQLNEANCQDMMTTEEYIRQGQITLALIGDCEPKEILDGHKFEVVIFLSAKTPDHQDRQKLANLCHLASQKLIFMGDFTYWPVCDSPPPLITSQMITTQMITTQMITSQNSSQGAWHNFILAEEKDPLKMYLGQSGPLTIHGNSLFLAQLPPLKKVPLDHELGQVSRLNLHYIVPPTATASENEPEQLLPLGPKKTKSQKSKPSGHNLNLNKKEPSLSSTTGMGLRAYGEIGPANFVSALLSAKTSLEFIKLPHRENSQVIILTPSPAQAKLVTLILKDIGAPLGRIFAGEPFDFSHWPQVDLVILDLAFEAPHQSHPWAWPASGRRQLMCAWELSKGEIWALGRDAWLARLPEKSPLAVLWGKAAFDPQISLSHTFPPPPPPFWEALDKAKSEVWAIMPPFEQFWWRPLEEHFLAAARRRVNVTILST
ncbi:MAG: hypothetical protein ACRCTY_00015, partial [Candidatus Adiutrix sp.]